MKPPSRRTIIRRAPPRGSRDLNMHDQHDASLTADGLCIGIACSRYHHDITDALRAAAVETFTAAGGEKLVVTDTPGAFELPVVCATLARRDDVDGVVALGCVIRGETDHDRYISAAVADGLTRIALETGKPVAFGLLTCHTLHQARERAGGEHGNKGTEAMAATIAAIHTVRELGGPVDATTDLGGGR
jgi:6,7-dimethyl-8-ribityllumazine synthase